MTLSIIFLSLALISVVIISFDVKRNPQSMKIMNAVWILTALWASIFGLIVYFWFGREKKMENTSKMSMNEASITEKKSMHMPKRPKWQSVTLSTLHCGAGCTLADIISSIFLFFIPITIYNSTQIGDWVFTYILALTIGVYFQYLAIKEMYKLPVSTIIKKAIKADFISLTAWELGMYGWMYFMIVKMDYIDPHTELNLKFWFVMQQAMLAGFVLSLPMNYILIKTGIKKGM